MKSGFFDKLIARIGKLNSDEVQNVLVRLVKEKGFLEKIFDSLQEGVLVTDVDGRINYVNRSACGFFGIHAEEAIDTRIDSQIRGLDWSSLIAQGQVVSRDIEVFYPESRFLNFYLSPIEDEEIEEPLGYVMIVRDITLTRKVTEERIESERLSALTLLAASVAHEIGNPLNSLNIHLQLVERRLRKAAPDLFKSQFQELFEIARNEIDRLDFTIAQFLKAIRPTRPVLEMHDINEVIREAANFLEQELKDRNIAVKLELRSNIPPMRLDANQLKQAFYNLIRNAMQAMSNDGLLTIRSDMNHYEVLVTFSDTGPGISPESMARVFEPYFTTKKSGSGLGLLIVRRVVREHGGDIELTSKPNEGTRVVVRLPRAKRPPRLLSSGESRDQDKA